MKNACDEVDYKLKLGCSLGCLLLLYLAVSGVSVAEDKVPMVTDNVKPIVKRHTLKELRNQNVVKQQLDYSCGAAALGTLMIYYFGEKTSEKEILNLLNIRLKKLTKEEISRKKRVGFSLLDLKYVAQQKGYKAAGFPLTLEQLKKIAAPIIVYILPQGYHHFAVLRGIAGNRVFLADPDRGNLSMSVDRFSKEYGDIAFVLGREGEERITHYPLALGQPGDYARPDWRRRVFTGNDFSAYTANLVLRVRARPLH
jgi:predicted double-glycine peptidase